MAGHPLRITNESDPCASFTNELEKQDKRLISLRRFLVRLALDSHSPEEVLSIAIRAVSETLQCRCSFIEGEMIPEAAPGHTAVIVQSDNTPLGALFISRGNTSKPDESLSELQEIADLVGLALLSARQAEASAELQSDSEDMLFHAPDAIFVASSDDIVRMANRRMMDFVDRPPADIVGEPISAVFGSPDVTWHSLAECAKSGELLEVELAFPAGRRFISISPSFVADDASKRILCVIRDITAEKQAPLAIRRTERALLMGQAVEYLLHEVNNPLAALRASLEQARKRALVTREFLTSTEKATSEERKDWALGTVEKLQQCLSNADMCSSRIRETMSVLRAAHQGEQRPVRSTVDPIYEITLALNSLEPEYQSSAVRIEREHTVRSKIHTAPLMIAEAVGALVRNALQALSGKQDGIIHISATETDSTFVITVRDNGPGVPRELAAKIFMPFFTTKPLGRNLGLGLTMVDDSLKRVGGSIRLVPTAFIGACFEIVLPK